MICADAERTAFIIRSRRFARLGVMTLIGAATVGAAILAAVSVLIAGMFITCALQIRWMDRPRAGGPLVLTLQHA
jgi:mRNA-degrading endonuclease toxin of MazEF toxin-antitoxin module